MVRPTYNLPADRGDDEHAIRHWLESLEGRYQPAGLEAVAGACAMLTRIHGDQRIETGETRVRHLLSTADILVGLEMDDETLVAALLNGSLEAQATSLADIEQRFGANVARMVDDLSRIGQLANVDAIIAAKDQSQHEENLRRLLLGIAEDVRVVLVVLAERVHLMRAIKDLEIRRRTRIARDTERVYAPLANRLGVWQLKWELEDLSLRYLQPEEYKRIARLLAERREEREHYIASVMEVLSEKFANSGISAEITGRPKHIYSIWKKMRRKGVDIEEIFDLRAVRIMVETVADCYAALGIVHGLWRHIPKEFDDYIATPKGNMYQSLHTAVIGPGDKSLEVQIRTYEMHRHAEFGVAAHWAYKEAKGHDAAFQRRLVWMRNWLELKGELEDPGEVLERFRQEFEPVHIYVLTPHAKVIELPKGATPLDFAYAIHSEVGNRCRGARVNGRIVPLHQRLESGDTVEILTQKNATPSRDWLSPHHGYLTTARARNRVRQWFKQQDLEQHAHEGRGLLEREIARLGIVEKPQLEALAERFNFKRGEDLLAAIGRGDVPVGQVARQVGEPRAEHSKESEHKPRHHPQRQRSEPSSAVVVEGVDDLMTQMAQCCKPVPHDPIIGFVTRGRGVTIHRRDCSNVRHLPPDEAERLISVRWADAPVEASYPVDLLVIAADRKGLLRDVSSVFVDDDLDVLGVETHSERTTDTASMRFTIEVRDQEQLGRVLVRLRQLPDVLEVRRAD
ncbi:MULTISPECIES: RelA/SpoT family protein [Marichromatium]|uniref:GTP pyrophosphokinase n=1 Tax=Marichromatium gracile TaxID=1048 RepID=A0A4V2WAK9_MARGR|nr:MULTISPECIES: bifunctional (p)ppGpp synthetase/guanosine-3',5'-bis(diphosphate) 3'-pyrophosphohydrolase [Marichromatium]MBK1707721.1 GTP diphosphokinase [Marichromatium gracile]MBO8085075.1 bifunctional (p)ppGpp synthetase/guanosine-3',5'-bis(diphosphate) 3'-pyrophosphohydrolase [Marichromatium sp.]RNE93867.1 bifunctional (p)ppGpp synthetase/guanosine-3',5'-bis(diphosphate) 3'-pyrophosphohydrolase [Marichromatium sp. AB32]TCW39710.1 GTP pyrophosphokinase [Marichromatium gracile]